LDFSAQSDPVASQQHEVHCVAAAANLPVHHHLFAAWNAAVWRTVRHCGQ